MVYGKGVNDSASSVNYLEDGIYTRCPYYTTWKSMLMRCYCKPYINKQKTYSSCTVCDEWLSFSVFRSWMKEQTWEGLHLDKDLILKGNKVYCPKLCSFIPRYVNNFLEMEKEGKGCDMLGVNYDKSRNKYVSGVRNALGKDIRNRRRIGCFESHIDYLKAKIIVGNLYIVSCDDSNTGKHLKTWLIEMQDCVDNNKEYKL